MSVHHKAFYNTPTDFSAVYFCPGCRRRYGDRASAVACSEGNEKAFYQPGDLIVIDVGYGWYDGDVRWLIDKGKASTPSGHMWAAYFIVTAVTHSEHRVRYSVKTLGIKNGNPTGLRGWTSVNHKRGTKVKNPDPKMIEEAKGFIGEVYDNLL